MRRIDKIFGYLQNKTNFLKTGYFGLKVVLLLKVELTRMRQRASWHVMGGPLAGLDILFFLFFFLFFHFQLFFQCNLYQVNIVVRINYMRELLNSIFVELTTKVMCISCVYYETTLQILSHNFFLGKTYMYTLCV
jgi:glutathionyl-hydroquinone reductase